MVEDTWDALLAFVRQLPLPIEKLQINLDVRGMRSFKVSAAFSNVQWELLAAELKRHSIRCHKNSITHDKMLELLLVGQLTTDMWKTKALGARVLAKMKDASTSTVQRKYLLTVRTSTLSFLDSLVYLSDQHSIA